MKNTTLSEFCMHGGGCTSKLDPTVLENLLEFIPQKADPNLLVGYEASDDGAVYKLTEEIALVQTLDFFTPIVEDAYMFGKIAAANALSDVYAMGGQVKTALNIVCFPEKMPPEILIDILKGGAEKVHEAGGIICGGHSINDDGVKYGLSVTGVVNPNKILKNNSCRIGDRIILTKPLGVAIVITAYKIGEGKLEHYEKACKQMETLNKYASEIMLGYDVSACTDVTGFGFLGHLNEMNNGGFTIKVDSKAVPYIDGAYEYAENFITTAGGQKNRNFLRNSVSMKNVNFPLQEIFYDPQTSGGLLISVSEKDCEKLLEELKASGAEACIVGEVIGREEYNIIVE